jgi:hypothetical protein
MVENRLEKPDVDPRVYLPKDSGGPLLLSPLQELTIYA